MTNARPVMPSATMRMMAAVPTTRPVSVSAVWTGCVRNLCTAVPNVSPGSSATRRLLLFRHGDARALRERRRAGEQDLVALREPFRHLHVRKADQPDRDGPASRA